MVPQSSGLLVLAPRAGKNSTFGALGSAPRASGFLSVGRAFSFRRSPVDGSIRVLVFDQVIDAFPQRVDPAQLFAEV